LNVAPGEVHVWNASFASQKGGLHHTFGDAPLEKSLLTHLQKYTYIFILPQTQKKEANMIDDYGTRIKIIINCTGQCTRH
jgi:hypothetical protein